MADYAKLLALDKKPPSKPASSPPRFQEEKNNSASLLVNQQTSKIPKQEENKPTHLPASKEANQQTSELPKKQRSKEATLSPAPLVNQHQADTTMLSTKEKTKYGTYLTDETIEKIGIRAIQTKRDAHQIVQDALNHYFEHLEK